VAAHGYGGLALGAGAAAAPAAAIVIPAAAAVTAASVTVATRRNRSERINVALTELPPTLHCVVYPDQTFPRE
jgi:hypothetical protein